jgi:O-antigen/teichoic acid export membrane protein
MDPRRLRKGEWIAAAGGVALLVSLFLPWYDPDVSAWEALSAIDVLLAILAASGVLLALATATQNVPAVPLALAGLVSLAGLVAFVLVLVKVADVPGAADGRAWALWLGLAGAAGLATGGAFAMRDERLSPPGRHTDATGRPIAAPPEIERLPAPRP